MWVCVLMAPTLQESRFSPQAKTSFSSFVGAGRQCAALAAPMMKSKHLVASFLYTHADILIKIVFDAEPRPDIPVIYIRIKRTDMVYVLQVKVESALAHVAPRYAVSADELVLDYKGRRLKETRALDFYSITEGSEVVASFCAVPSEQESVVAQPDYAYLDQLVQATPGVPSSGMVKSIISQFGFHCQVTLTLALALTLTLTLSLPRPGVLASPLVPLRGAARLPYLATRGVPRLDRGRVAALLPAHQPALERTRAAAAGRRAVEGAMAQDARPQSAARGRPVLQRAASHPVAPRGA